jgi:hypothetical protein
MKKSNQNNNETIQLNIKKLEIIEFLNMIYITYYLIYKINHISYYLISFIYKIINHLVKINIKYFSLL